MARTRKRRVVPSTGARGQQAETFTFTMRLPAELAAELAAIATDEGRSRAKQIEMMLREAVQSYRRRPAA